MNVRLAFPVIDRMAASGSLPPASGVVPARNLQAAGDVPYGQFPVVLAAKLGDFGQDIVVLMGLYPEAGKTGRNVFRQTLSE